MRAAALCAALAVALLASWLLPRLAAPPDRFSVARELLEAGRPEDAVHLFNTASWRGVAEYRAGRFHRALAEFFREESAENLYNMGNAYARLHEWRAAREAYLRTLDLDPRHADARHNLAVIASAEAAERRQRDEAQETKRLGRWRDGERDDPQSGTEAGGEPVEGDAAGGEMRPAGMPGGIPGESDQAGLPGGDPAAGDPRAGPADAAGAGEAPPESGAGAGGRMILRASRQDAEILLGRIEDDPARVLAARLRAAHRLRQEQR